MNRFYLLVLMKSFVDITAKRRRHQSRSVIRCSIHPRGGGTNHYIVHIRWFQFGSLGRNQSQTGCSLCIFS